MRPRSDAKLDVGPRDVQLAKEPRRHGIVIVLAGVQQDLPMLSPQERADRRGFDELRARADDGENGQ